MQTQNVMGFVVRRNCYHMHVCGADTALIKMFSLCFFANERFIVTSTVLKLCTLGMT